MHNAQNKSKNFLPHIPGASFEVGKASTRGQHCEALEKVSKKFLICSVQKPLILVTTSGDNRCRKHCIGSAYIDAIYKSGAIPLAAFPDPDNPQNTDGVLSKADGLLLIGGDDVHPLLYGQDPQPALGVVSKKRDDFEIALVLAALSINLPVLAICRGMQVINVAFGGTLFQDIATAKQGRAILHEQTAPRDTLWHSVSIEPQSRLAQIYAGLFEKNHTLPVNSIHHQAVDKVAEGWKVTAVAPDGIIEAIEKESEGFAVAVQWHPEELPGHRVIFDAFVHAARMRHC